MADSILNEIGQIDHLLDFFADLLSRAQQRTPDKVEVAALSSVLHSFYMGLENIFLVIAKQLDAKMPGGSNWHSALLTQMATTNARRGQVISVELMQKLGDYLGFRHVARHAYSFQFDWDLMAANVENLHDVWAQTKSELLVFVESLNRE